MQNECTIRTSLLISGNRTNNADILSHLQKIKWSCYLLEILDLHVSLTGIISTIIR